MEKGFFNDRERERERERRKAQVFRQDTTLGIGGVEKAVNFLRVEKGAKKAGEVHWRYETDAHRSIAKVSPQLDTHRLQLTL